MPQILPDRTKPLDLTGVELRERHGYTEAVCPCCGSWVRVEEKFYAGDRTVFRAIPHEYPCHAYENFGRHQDASRNGDA